MGDFPIEVKRLHRKMFNELDRSIAPNSTEFGCFKCMAEMYLTKGETSQCDHILDMLGKLETKGIIAHGDYSALKTILDDATLGESLKLVRVLETDIFKALGRTVTPEVGRQPTGLTNRNLTVTEGDGKRENQLHERMKKETIEQWKRKRQQQLKHLESILEDGIAKRTSEQTRMLMEGLEEKANFMTSDIDLLKERKRLVEKELRSIRPERCEGTVSIFQQPACLIVVGDDGKCRTVQTVLDEIKQIDKPLNIVAIAGPYRSGKSYLMNRLAGERKGFALGSTIQTKTKGISVWCRPHPVHDDQVLVLLDTAGLGDVSKGYDHDHWIFALAVLLSSTLIHNCVGVFDQNTLDRMSYVNDISDYIKTAASETGAEIEDFDLHFPRYVLVLRDFMLELQMDGREISSDDYLEECLKCLPERDRRSRMYNLPRLSIRQYFKKRKCFTLTRPGNHKILRRLDNISDEELEPDFVDEVTKFCKFIHEQCGQKQLDTGNPVTGRMFVALVTSYVEAIQKGTIPCIEDARKTMAFLENQKTMGEAIKLYQEKMADKLQTLADTYAMLSDVHIACTKEAVTHFLNTAIDDEGNKLLTKLNEQIANNFEEIKIKNEEISEEKCRKVLHQLNKPIMEKLTSGAYDRTGGYAIYQHDLRELQIKFDSTPGLGVKAKDALSVFLQEHQRPF